MGQRRGRRRRWLLGLTSVAAAGAAALALTPLLAGSGSRVNSGAIGSFFNQAETGVFDHNLAHRASPPAAKRAARAQAAACEDPAQVAADPEACPQDGATSREVAAAEASAAAPAPPALSEASDGLWGPLQQIPSTAVHGVLMPTGKVLYFSQPKYPTETEAGDGGTAHVWDPATGQTKAVPPPVVAYEGRDSGAITAPANLWCGGQTLLPDGRVLVVGGNLEYPTPSALGDRSGFKGAKWVMTFDPWSETWTRYQDMPHGRWYPTLTTMPDGKVLIIGGWDETGGDAGGNPSAAPVMKNDQDVEVFDPARAVGAGADPTTVVSHLPPNYGADPNYNGAPYPDHQGIGLYPHVFVLPDTTEAGSGGDPKVLVAGPLQWDSAIIDTGTWEWTDVLDQPYDPGDVPLSSDRAWGTAYLEPSGPNGSTRVVLLGGSNSAAAAPGAGSTAPPLSTAEVLDLNDWRTGWHLDPDLDLRTGRAHFNTVLLPDGSVFTNGGGYGRRDGSMYAGPVFSSELLAPGGAGGWRTVGSEQDARTYHSTALLLPDGRVISAGDDRDIAPADHGGNVDGHLRLADRTYQLYNPPYLFKGAAPQITFAPARVRYDAPFRVAVAGDPGSVTGAHLMAPGAVTHANDMNQRAIELNLTTQPDGVTLTTPLDDTVAPPGYYMLFLQNADGAVSSAAWIRIDPNAPDAPPLPGDRSSGGGTAPPPGTAVPAPKATTPAPSAPKVVVATRRGVTRATVSAILPKALAGRRVAIERRIGRSVYALATVSLPKSGRLSRAIVLKRAAAPGGRAPTGIKGARGIRLRLRVLPTATAAAGIGRYRSVPIGAAALRNRR